MSEELTTVFTILEGGGGDLRIISVGVKEEKKKGKGLSSNSPLTQGPRGEKETKERWAVRILTITKGGGGEVTVR